jgi:hypothetical protein
MPSSYNFLCLHELFDPPSYSIEGIISITFLKQINFGILQEKRFVGSILSLFISILCISRIRN